MSPRRWRRLCAVEWGGLLTGEVLAGRFFGESAGDEMRVVEAGFGVAEFVAVEGGKHLWVGEEQTYRVLTEIVARLNPGVLPLPRTWEG